MIKSVKKQFTMIKSLSPYYVDVPFVSPLTSEICTQYTMKIYAWNGNKNLVPLTPTYTLTKKNPTGSNASDKIDIARLINDFIVFTPQEGTGVELIDGNNQYWVKTEILYKTSDILDDGVSQLETTNLMLRGYGYGMDGQNAQPPADKIMMFGREFKVNRGGVFSLPILIDENNEISGVIEITSIIYNSIVPRVSANIEINYTIDTLTPTNVTLQTADFEGLFEWVNQETRPNSSPLTLVTITFGEILSKDIRLVFTIGENVYVSNVITVET